MPRLPRAAVRRICVGAAATLAAGLLAAPASSSSAGTGTGSRAASGAAGAPAGAAVPGSAGIGDPYFPLDGNGGIDVLRYRIRDRYDPETGRLRGRTRLTLTATTDLSRFNLDLLLPVRGVRVAGERASYRKPHRHELQVTPVRPLAAGRTVDVVVRYAGRPAELAYLGERNWMASTREVVAMNQPHMAPWWFPANDHPRDKALMDITITTPRWMHVVANGELVGRRARDGWATTRWRAAEPMAPYLAFFAAGDFDIASGIADGRRWYAAVSRAIPQPQRHRSMRLMRRTPEVVAWAAGILGPYPFTTTGGVTTALDTGFALENQTRPVYPVLRYQPILVVAHEIAHQWFGNSVSVRSWRDIWLSEGAATFMEARWVEDHGGQSGQDWLELTYEGLRNEPSFWRRRVDAPGPGGLFSEAVYVRGGMTFQALRRVVGEEDFVELLRAWVAERRGGHGSTAEFTALAERVSGRDLDAFFHAWLRADTPPARTAANGF